MMKQPFAVTRRTEKLINRQGELSQLYDAIYHPAADCQVMFILGQGGIGKSRLAEEVLWRGGNSQMRRERSLPPQGDEDWSAQETDQGLTAVYADLIDLSDPRYNNRASLMQAVRDALVGQDDVSFNDYDRERSEYLGLLQIGADQRTLDPKANEVEENFNKDLKDNGKDHRLVLVFDTAEKLQFGATRELIAEDILKASDFAHNSIQWLVELVQQGSWINSTMVLVGREEEGREFFNALRAARKPGMNPIELRLSPFSSADVQTYFQQLAMDWRSIAVENPQWEPVSMQLKFLAEDEEQCNVLWLYTGGQPVRLAMYANILLQGSRVPKPMKDSWERAVERVGTQDPVNSPTDELTNAQREIEKEFISLIFQEPGLDADILKTLVRTPRGLTHDQLVYLLFAPVGARPGDWQPENEQAKQVSAAIERMLLLSIIKKRPNQRLGLQDEVYHIYTRNMCLDSQNREDEEKERKGLYKKLVAWAQYQVKAFQAKRREFQEKDEASLQIENLAQVLRLEFSDPGKIERDRRAGIYEAIRSWRLEAIHYDILIDPVDHLNESLCEITDRKYFGTDENEDWMILNEINRVLNDADLLAFIPLQPWLSLQENQETVEVALQRVMRQQEYTQWLRRFALRGRYREALEYYAKLEAYIQRWDEGRERTSFLHTLSAHERLGWKLYCQILMGDGIAQAIDELDRLTEDLKKLASKSQDEVAIPEKGEKGFVGHPAEDRLKTIIGQQLNIAGYGRASLGDDTRAQENYTRAITLFHEIKHPQEPTVTNNLSRALSDQGSPYARLVCLDGLNRRIDLSGLDVAYAYSLNTLALIDNDSFRPDLAWREAAQALAYFKRAKNLRGEGLALLQLAEALRRIAREEIIITTLVENPEPIYELALKAVRRAESIFTNDVPEKIRQIEAYIEMGCVHRDLIRFYEKLPVEKESNYKEALGCFRSADRLAKEEEILRYQIDSQVNVAWTQYYVRDIVAARKAIQKAEGLFPDNSQIIPGYELPSSKRDDMYVYYQWGKLSALSGRIEMERFRAYTEQVKEQNPKVSPQERSRLVSENFDAMTALREGARAFILAAGYNWLFSSRSPIVRMVEEPLYEYLKKFNRYELELFLKEYQVAIKEHQLEGKVFIHELINKCFGSFSSG